MKERYMNYDRSVHMGIGKILIFMLAVLFGSTFLGGNAFADNTAAVQDATKTIKSFGSGNITREALKTALEDKYAAGTLTRADLKTALAVAYNHNILKRDDVKFVLAKMYKEGKLTRADLRWVLTQAYKNKELTRDDLRYIITAAYKTGELTKEDVKFLVVEAYKAGELRRDDVRWILAHAYKEGQLTRADLKWLIVNAYKEGVLTREDVRELITVAYNHGELTREDMKWLLVNSYKEGLLTREDLRIIITAAYNHGELTRADLKWLIVNGYKAGELTKEDVKELLKAAYKKGELRKSDVEWILNESYKANELSQSDVSIAETTGTTVAVEAQPAPVPSMPEQTSATIAVAAESAEPSTGTTATTTKDGLKTSQAWMLYKYALIPAERHRIGMDALIGYVESIGGSTTKLTELKDTFVSQQDSLKAAAEKADYTGGRAIVGQMKQTVASFKTEVKTLVGNNTQAAKDAVNSALTANEDYLDSLVTEAREAKRDRNLEAFDFANAKIQARLDKAKSNGADVSALQAKLDEITAKRSALLEAMNKGVDSCKGEGLGKCNTTEAQEYITLRAELVNDYKSLAELAKQVGQGQKINNAINQAYKIISNSEKTLDTAAGKGRDVTAQKAKLSEIKGMVDAADTKYRANDYTGATNDLKSAQSAFEALKQSAGRAK